MLPASAKSVLADSSTTATSIAAVEIVASEADTFGSVATFAAPAAQTLFLECARSASTVSTLEAAAPVAQAVSPVVGVVGFLNSHRHKPARPPSSSPAPNTPGPPHPGGVGGAGLGPAQLLQRGPDRQRRPHHDTGRANRHRHPCHRPRGRPLDLHGHGCDPGEFVRRGIPIPAGSPSTRPPAASPSPRTTSTTMARRPHSFTVSVTDGKTNLLSLFGVPHSDTRRLPASRC